MITEDYNFIYGVFFLYYIITSKNTRPLLTHIPSFLQLTRFEAIKGCKFAEFIATKACKFAEFIPIEACRFTEFGANKGCKFTKFVANNAVS
jgi:hypothetical protein